MKKVENKNIPLGAREKTPFWYGMLWSSRGISAAVNVMLVGYVTFYATDILGLNMGILGVIFLVSKIVDAFTDLVAGFIVDRTHTRLGKARPYEIFIVFQWILLVMLYNVPDMSATLQYVWLLVIYILINAVCLTALNAADAVNLSRTFVTENNRTRVISINGVAVMLVVTVVSILIPQFIASIGSSKQGWVMMMIYIAIPMTIIGVLRLLFVKEIVDDEKPVTSDHEEHKRTVFDVKDTFKALANNKYMFIIAALLFLVNIVNNMSAATTYYFKYIIGDVGKQSYVGMTSLSILIFLAFFPAFCRRFGSTKVLQICLFIGIIGMAIRTVGGSNIVTILIGSVLFNLSTMPIAMMINTYIIDCMDYGEWKTGIRLESVIASTTNFVGKVGAGLASGLLGMIMSLGGYDGTLDVQSVSGNAAIVIAYNIVPLILFILMFIISRSYKMDSIREQIRNDLNRG